jgi:hypothetical protein
VPTKRTPLDIATLAFILIICLQLPIAAERDPHRPPCKTTRCLQIKSFLKAHYCGESPYGEGPDDGCEIRIPPTPFPEMQVVAELKCDWDDKRDEQVCQQRGQAPAAIRTIVIREMRRLGLGATEDDQIKFDILTSKSAGWSVVAGSYYRRRGENAAFCQVIVTVDETSHVNVLRIHRFGNTDPDVPKGTSWSPLGIADVNGDGEAEIILQADEYENHWLEVVSLHEGEARTIFSGLGYYL